MLDQIQKYPDNNPKSSFGVRKAGLSFLPWAGVYQAGHAMEFGALHANNGKGYGPFNWRGANSKVAASVYFDAGMRHRLAWWDGLENFAPDSLAHHLGHGIACDLIILDAMMIGNLVDDRPAVTGGVLPTLADIAARKDQFARALQAA